MTMRVVMVYPNKEQEEKRFVSFYMYVNNKFIDMNYSKEDGVDSSNNDKNLLQNAVIDHNKTKTKSPKIHSKDSENTIQYTTTNEIGLVQEVPTLISPSLSNTNFTNFLAADKDIIPSSSNQNNFKFNDLNQNEMIRYHSTSKINKIAVAKSQRKKKLVFIKTLPLNENHNDKNQFINNRMINNVGSIQNSTELQVSPNILQTKEQFLVGADLRSYTRNHSRYNNKSAPVLLNSLNNVKNKNANTAIEKHDKYTMKYIDTKNDYNTAGNSNLFLTQNNASKFDSFENSFSNRKNHDTNWNNKATASLDKNGQDIYMVPQASKEFTTFKFKVSENRK